MQSYPMRKCVPRSSKIKHYILVPSSTRNLISRLSSTNNATNKGTETGSLKPWTDIPGPASVPIIGQLMQFLPGIGRFAKMDRNELLQTLGDSYGPIFKQDSMLGRPPVIFLRDPEAIAQVLRGETEMPIRNGFYSFEYFRKYYRKTKEESLKPTGLITDHNQNWREFRTKVNPILMQPKTIKLYRSVLDEVALDMVQRIRNLRDKDNKVIKDLDIEMNKWSLESIGTVALGGRIGCLDPNLPDDSPVRELIDCVHEIFTIAEDLEFKPSLWRYYPTRKFRKAMKLYAQQMELGEYFVNRAIVDLKATQGQRTYEEKGILEKLLEIDVNTAVIMASDMLFAGVDTSANTVLSTLYLLARNKEKQEKLREEIKSTKENDSRPYLRACLKEAMRMMPVTSGNMRQTTKEYNLLGYSIPKGIDMFLCHQHLSKLESQYPQPDQFIPERWIVDTNHPLHYSSAHPFTTQPFGFGVRMCIGRRIAELEINTFIARMVESFDIDWNGPPPKVVTTMMNYITGPFHFVFNDI